MLQALQEISVEERKRTLDNSRLELAGIEKRIEQVNKDFKSMEKKVQEAVKRVVILSDFNLYISWFVIFKLFIYYE